jgi:hypothetical protein
MAHGAYFARNPAVQPAVADSASSQHDAGGVSLHGLVKTSDHKLAADRIGLDRQRMVHEHHSVWSPSRRAIAYPDPGTTML